MEVPEDNPFPNIWKEHLVDMCLASVISRYNIVEAKKHFIKGSDIIARSLGADTWCKVAVRNGLHCQ